MFIILIATFAIGLIKTDTPQEFTGTMEITGNIANCVTKELSGSTRARPKKYFLGLTLDTAGAPYIRTNPSVNDREYYKNLCSSKATVSIKYTAQNMLTGGLRFWMESITVIKHNKSSNLTRKSAVSLRYTLLSRSS